jgi:hypothetical protein
MFHETHRISSSILWLVGETLGRARLVGELVAPAEWPVTLAAGFNA